MAAAGTLTINGTPRSVRDGSLRIVDNVNRRSSLAATIVSLTGAYSPSEDDDVVFTDASSNVLFGGAVRTVSQDYQAQGATLFSPIACEDYTALAERRFVSGSVTAGLTGRDAIDLVVTNYLAAYGVTRDAGMPTGAGPGPFSMTTGSSKVAGGDIKITRSLEYYANRVVLVYGDGTSTPATVSADDAGEQATYGIYEQVIRSAGPFDVTTAQAVCDAYLTQLLARPRSIVFQPRQAGARAGQTLSVNLSARGLVGDFLITQIETRDWEGKYLFHTITAVEGGVLPPTWKDQTAGGSTGSSGLVSGGGSVIISQIGRSSYWLGGSMFAGDQSAGPSVLNAVDYVDVMLDTAAIGAGTSVTAVVMCKAGTAGVTVTPQVYNVTTASVAGTGSAVTGTTITTVTFAITVTAGQNLYRLRMTPGTANIDVFCQGYLEVGR